MKAPTPPADPLDLLREQPEKPETAKSAFRQLLAVTVVFGALLGGYWWHSHRVYVVKLLASEAVPFVWKGDAASLRMAEKKYVEAIDKGGSDLVRSSLAEVYALLWVEHGYSDAKAKAQELTARIVKDKVENAQRYSAQGLVALGEGRLAEAEKVLIAVVDRGAVSERVFFVLGKVALALGKPKVAKDYLKRAQGTRSDAPHYNRALGDAYDDNNDNSDAGFMYEAAAKANPSYKQGMALDLISKIRRGEDRKTTAELLRSLAARPASEDGPAAHAMVLYAEAVLGYVSGDTKAALAFINSALQEGGDLPKYHLLRGRILIADNKTKEGLQDLVAAQTKAPGADRYLYSLVDAEIDLGKADDALKTLQAAAGSRADSPAYFTALGNAYVAKQDWKQAKAAFEKAASFDAEYPYGLLGQAIAEWKQKNYAQALPWFEKAIVAQPKFPEVYESIGLMFVDQGAQAQGNTQLDMGEKLFRATEADPARMKHFYATIIKTYSGSKGGSAFVKDWQNREKAYKEGTQAALE